MEDLDQVDYYPEEGSDITEWYTTPYLPQLIHEIPHFSIFLKYVNDTIELDSNQYVESLCVFSSVFLLLLVMTYVLLSGVLVQSLFSMTFQSSHTMVSIKKTLMEWTTMVLMFVIIGCWGEVIMHRSIEFMIMEWHEITRRLDDVAIQAYYLNQEFGVNYMVTYNKWVNVKDMQQLPDSLSINTIFKDLESTRAEILRMTRQISHPIIEMSQSKLVKTLLRLESSRASAGMAGWCAAVFLAMVGTFASTLSFLPRGLALVAVAALCGITGNYLAAAVGSSVLLAMSDACVDPFRFVTHHLAVFKYYEKYFHFLICDENEEKKPPKDSIEQIRSEMLNFEKRFAKLSIEDVYEHCNENNTGKNIKFG